MLILYGRDRLSESPIASSIYENILASQDSEKIVQFLLDPSAVPEIIAATQNIPEILPLFFRVTATWCYSLHRTRLKLLGMWT